MSDREKLVEALRKKGQNCGRHSPMASPKGCATEVADPRDWCLSCLAVAAADLLDEGRETERRAECVDCGKTVILARPQPERKP